MDRVLAALGRALRSAWRSLASLWQDERQPPLPFDSHLVRVAPAAPRGGPDPHELAADLEAVAKACERAGEFSRSDITRATGLGVDVVKRRLNALLDMGWIEREKHGDYRWKGRRFWSA